MEFGFIIKLDDGSVNISNNQPMRIINIDKTCFSLDGWSRKCSGCPEIM